MSFGVSFDFCCESFSDSAVFLVDCFSSAFSCPAFFVLDFGKKAFIKDVRAPGVFLLPLPYSLIGGRFSSFLSFDSSSYSISSKLSAYSVVKTPLSLRFSFFAF